MAIQAGAFIYAADHNVTPQVYTPVLEAGTTDPTLGTGSTQIGRYYVEPISGWVRGQAKIRFGTTGTDAGSGIYLISLPTEINPFTTNQLLGFADVIGWGVVRDDSSAVTGPRLVVLHYWSASGSSDGTGQAYMAICDGTNDVVQHNRPFSWAASDAISVQFAYPGA